MYLTIDHHRREPVGVWGGLTTVGFVAVTLGQIMHGLTPEHFSPIGKWLGRVVSIVR